MPKNKITLKNKNVILFLKTFELGGAERQALALANHLQNKCECKVYIISYFTSKNPQSFYDICELYNLENVLKVKNPFETGKKYKFIKKCIKLIQLGLQLKKYKPDLLIPYLNRPSTIVNIIRPLTGAKHSFWNHRGTEDYKFDFFEKIAVNRTKSFIANSSNGVMELTEKFKLNKKKVFFVPNFNTLTSLVDKPVKESLVIGMFAHFRIEKLQELLLESCAPLLKKYNNLQLLLLGNISDENKYEKVKELIKTSSLEDKVSVFHNKLSIDFLNKLDIGVLISTNEGMSNTIMEYMYFGLPVVATNLEGTSYLLSKDNSPYLVANNQIEITNKLEELILDPLKRSRIGSSNREKITKSFSVDKFIDNIETILNE